MTAELIELPAHERMTPEQCLAVCAREPWERVIVVGYQEGRGDVVLRSSGMTREQALWIVEWARRHALGLDE